MDTLVLCWTRCSSRSLSLSLYLFLSQPQRDVTLFIRLRGSNTPRFVGFSAGLFLQGMPA